MKLSAAPVCCKGMEADVETGANKKERDPLAERLADGDLDAPRELVSMHYAGLYRYAMSMLRDQAAAEDAAQAALEKALLALGGYSEARVRALALRPWLYRITLNVVRNRVRDGKHEVSLSEVPEGPDVRTQPFSDRDRETWLDVSEALGRLPERQRVAVSLRYLSDLPYAEISEATGWPEGTAKTLVRRGVIRLRALLLTETEKEGLA